MRLVHLVRDSRAVASPGQRERVRPEIRGGKAYMARFNAITASKIWLTSNLLIGRLARRR